VRKWLQSARFRLARRKLRTVEPVPGPRPDDSALLGALAEQPALPLVAEGLLADRERSRRRNDRRGSRARDYDA
jgi:hypothetical protein